MKIASWNINGIRARIGLLKDWIETEAPDVLLLQEIKCETDQFPLFEIKALGYHAYVLGQKAYNGVAIISRQEATDMRQGLMKDDPQARYIEAQIGDMLVASLYLPNGNPAPGEKYDYKLAWMEQLKTRAEALLKTEKPVVLGGDFNVIPAPEDVYDPQGWQNDALYRPQTRQIWRSILNLGFTDAYRALHPHEEKSYTFWDYQAGAWQKDLGLRIDHFLLSPEAASRLDSCTIDRAPRAQEKASDHTPIVVALTP
ncbi:MAG: exodeoxyribonuclease III [Alphaproteobacteria bacterium]|nr:exodeoxyribonuclease III [Alphaproteobacteria bacterium]